MITGRRAFFSEYALPEISVQAPMDDVIFDSLQPVNITQTIVQEYEPEINYSFPIIILIDLYYELSNLAKLFGTGVDIGLSLLDIESRLTDLYDKHSRAFHCTFQYNQQNWWNSAFCFSIFHVCIIILYRLHIFVKCKFNVNMSHTYRSCMTSADHDVLHIEYYLDNCNQSAILLTKICNSLMQLKSQVVPIYFVQFMIQSTVIHMISLSISRSDGAIDTCNESVNLINTNMKFIESFQGLQAHTSLVLESLNKLKERLNSLEIHLNLDLVFEYAHETLDFDIPSIYAKDIDMYKELERSDEDVDSISQFSLHYSETLANMTEINMLNDLINKFAL